MKKKTRKLLIEKQKFENQKSKITPQKRALKLSALQYSKTTGEPPRRFAGFLAHCKLHFGLEKKLPSEWRKIWDEFWNKPVK